MQVLVTVQEPGCWGTYKLQLLPSQTSMVHVSMREHEKHEDIFESLAVYVSACVCYTVCWNKNKPNGSSFIKRLLSIVF